ncbi:hypothetical protein ACO0RG_001687 [Hanseniaspora osmophila]
MDQEFSRTAPSGETFVITKHEDDGVYHISENLCKVNPNYQLPTNKTILESEYIFKDDLIDYLQSLSLFDLFSDIFIQNNESSKSKTSSFGSPNSGLTMEFTTSSDAVTFTTKQKQALEFFLQRVLAPTNNSDSSRGKELHAKKDHAKVILQNVFQDFKNIYPNEVLNLKIPIDENGSTALHWLGSLANSNLIREIVQYQKETSAMSSAGPNGKVKIEMDISLGDAMGESALVKAVKTVNNYENGTFEGLLEVLYPSLNLLDNQKKTILHHIILQSGKQGCAIAAKYYLDIFMAWVVKPGGVEVDGHTVTLQWFINNVLNAQDVEGDTCLSLASRLGNVAFVNLLLDYGADPAIANNSGLKPLDYGATLRTNDQQKFPNGITDQTNSCDIKFENASSNGSLRVPFDLPNNAPMMDHMAKLIESINATYKEELTSFNNEMEELQKNIHIKNVELNTVRHKIYQYQALKDEYSKLQEQITSLKSGIRDQKKLFQVLSQDFPELLEETGGSGSLEPEESNSAQGTQEIPDYDEFGNSRSASTDGVVKNSESLNSDDNKDEKHTNGSGEEEEEKEEEETFDADEPFKIDFVYSYLSDKLENEFNGDIDKMEQSIDIQQLVEHFMETETTSDEAQSNIEDLPSLSELQFRLKMYEENEVGLDRFYKQVQEEQENLESKFKRVLSLCLKVDESKVDSMLDGLLEAISNEDLENLALDDVQSFLKQNETMIT